MDKLTIRWIKDQLTNNEYDSDEELRAYFIEGGLAPEEADQWIAKRDFYRLNMVMQDEDGEDIGIYDPHKRTIKPLSDDNGHK
jgi:hypothetical protein